MDTRQRAFDNMPLSMATLLEREVGNNPCDYNPPPTPLLRSSQDLKPGLDHDLPTPSTANEVPGLLRLPLELRWQIFHPLLRADDDQICEHAQTQLPFIIWNGGKREQAPKTGVQPSVLLLNRQIYRELLPLLYSENLIYLEPFFGSDPVKKLRINSPLPILLPIQLSLASMGKFVKQIGFSVFQEPSSMNYSCNSSREDDEEIHNGSNRLRLEIYCRELRQHLPNLQLAYVNIFTHPQRPEEGFLLHLVRTLHTLPGRRILVIHGSNREKVRVVNILRSSISQSADLVLGSCICYTSRTSKTSRSNGGTPDFPPFTRFWFQNVLWLRNHPHCTLPPYLSRRVKGCRIGCLLCKFGSKGCVHDPAYRPQRLEVITVRDVEDPPLIDFGAL